MHIAHPVPASTRVSGTTHTRRFSPALTRLSHIATAGLIVAFALFLMMVGGFALYAFSYTDRVYEGTSIAGVDVGGMTQDEVTEVVASQFAEFASSTVSLTAGDRTFERTASELGVAIDVPATVDRVMTLGRDGSPWDRSLVWTRGFLDGHETTPVLTVDYDTFHGAMVDLSPDVVYAPSNARVDIHSSGEAILVEDVPGRSIDVGGTLAHVLGTVINPDGDEAPIALVSMPAGVRTADVEAGLPEAERALAGSLIVEAPEGRWALTRSMLSDLVSVDDAGQLRVDRDGVEAWVAGVAAQVDRPAVDAGITIDETGAIQVVPQVDAATVNQAATAEQLVDAIVSGGDAVDLIVDRAEPAILDRHAEQWAREVDILVGDGISLNWKGGSSQLGRADLIAALVITPTPEDDEKFDLSLDPSVIAERLAPLQADLYIESREAQFRLVDGQIRFQTEARQGRQLEMDESVETIVNAIHGGDPVAPISVSVIEPTYTSQSRGDIELPDVLGVSSTYYGNSSEPRRKNVERAVELEDGWLIPPGGIFSFAAFSGLITEENGFVTGFGIVADPGGGVTTAPVIGGGICQVSTTIYQAAFWAGLSIVERWAHPYWLDGYGQAPYGMRGLDAMVNIEPDWALDLKFENTTGNWIAVVMRADGQDVHAEILGTDPGWEIDVPDPVITNVVTPEDGMNYTDSPELPRGQELQVERAREGFTSEITRIIRSGDGQVVEEYVQKSTYSASRNLTLRGTGEAD